MSDSLLGTVEEVTGALPKEWRAALQAVPRAHFLPDVVWLRGESGTHEPCDRRTDLERWESAAVSDQPVVVQVRDGDGREANGEEPWPSSSASQPSVVARALVDLELHDGMRVLEIGTGSGWNAGLLAHRLGGSGVVSVEIDTDLATLARGRLAELGLTPHIVAGDGAEGYPPGSPYDRIAATCSISRVPMAWLCQVTRGGRIVAPWSTGWMQFGTATLHVRDGRASGRFRADGSFMPMRAQRFAIDGIEDVLDPGDRPDVGTTALSPWVVAGRDDIAADFAVGLRTGDVWHHWDTAPDEDDASVRVWLGDEAGTSWASVDFDGRQLETFAVRQHGPRRVWDEVEAAWQWWQSRNSPPPERFGLTVRADGSHHYWLDHEADYVRKDR